MEIRNLGQSGLRVSAIGLGCNNFGGRIDFETTRKVIFKALDLGITLFDTADTYGSRGGSETEMGQVLGDERKRIVLATKFGNPMDDAGVKVGGSRHYIMQAVEDSLRRLRTDWIDLYQIHAPDSRTPLEETLRALDDLVRQGKVRYIGCSNFPAWQVVDAQWTAKANNLTAFISCQDEYSLLVRDVVEPQLKPAMLKFGMGLLPFFPLASGLLTGKYRRNRALPAGARLVRVERLADRYLTERNWTIAEQLADFVEGRGHTMLELAFSWLLSQQPVASVIAGATGPEQLEQNVQAGNWKLSDAELGEINRITAA
jgi:aryl-alcohol dehydrogenase-like predicted oxidoreductase